MIQHSSRFTISLKSFFSVAAFSLISVLSFSQENRFNNDFQAWFFVKVDQRIGDKWTLALTAADRLENNASFQKAVFVEPAVRYSTNSGVKIGLAYRHSIDPDDNSHDQKLISRISYGYRLKPFKLGYRFRVDHELGDDKLVDVFRNRFSFGYSRKKHAFTPEISYEFFTDNKSRGWLFNRWRLKVSTGYKLKKRNVIELFYMIQREIKESSPKQDFVLGVGYNYSLKKIKKKKPKE